jgi:hypothetical protein
MLTAIESTKLKVLHAHVVEAIAQLEYAKMNKDIAVSAFEEYIHTLSSLPDNPNSSWIYGNTEGIGILGNTRAESAVP